MGVGEMKQIAAWIDQVLSDPSDTICARVSQEVKDLVNQFPAPGIVRPAPGAST
jgi:glycine/serine hydroxymethyltransferase